MKPISWSIAIACLVGVACGDSAPSQAEARDRAAAAACDSYQRCGEIGSGKTYVSQDDCLTKQKASWQSTWPPETCDGKISSGAFNNCIDLIERFQCGNLLQFADLALNQCPASTVCAGK